ncbi:bifunctional alpha,alpha-trehalose-phosphate synthase (UDP-forming)/trehalose-phosphatase [Cesiribacter andamanensis]|uniref:Alpha,alpha-trehalose-phosphate synthase n=1 Tax=Cesiribacter andamanensis AMV16 TaxID=1279009 RepID=M7N0U1_9BACT|nr:bifunctional alpha,alpha-trehalose-phosphate synthase (UDP-forming)/trehalose-phosphatase [Cesiribacter andamanensis]EMR00932.1 Trehalose-phosphate synthase [Cesiribacter andamanensis AMV16]
MPKTIIVSNRLPVKIQKGDQGLEYQTSEGGLATGLGSIYKEGNNVWIGWPGLYVDSKETEQEITTRLQESNMSPVFLSAEEIRDYYEGFSNETLWPTFHYFSNYAIYENELWEAYFRVNLKFCEEVVRLAEPGDTLWIHDYQLLLLPQLIRERLPESSIGFFLHIPFPSYEVFRMLPWRRQLLKGLLGADLIGFHTYDDMRHFLSSVNRIVMLTHTNGQVDVNNRRVLVDAFPMGIDYQNYAATAAAPDTIKKEVRFRTALGEVKVALSIDRLDYSKGIPNRLQAFEMFLERYPEWRGKVSLVMVLVPSRDRVGRYKDLKEDIDERVGRINGQYGRLNWTPVHYFYRSFPLNSLSAFYRIADVALVTPMRDGMNLVAKEYVASKLDQRGVLVLSEMAGASRELLDSLQINPNDINGMVDAIHASLVMSESEQERRMSNMQATIRKYDIHNWVRVFMDRLSFIKEKQDKMSTQQLDEAAVSQILESFTAASRRFVFADYDGTLMPFEDNPLMARPDDDLDQLLQQLSGNKQNELVIVSSRTADTLYKWLGSMPIYLVAEHGIYIRKQDSTFEKIERVDNSWKDEIRPILEDYVGRTPGAFLEEKDYSLVWHYRRVQSGLGELRMRELTSHLKYLASTLNLQVIDGENIVEVKSLEVNKGKAARHLLEELPEADFILCFGNDWTDEDTFRNMPEHAVTIRVGPGPSIAKYRVSNWQEVRRLLKKLNQSTKIVNEAGV